MRLGLPVVGLALLLGCGSSGDKASPATLSGTVDGTAFTAKGAVAVRPAIDTCVAPTATVPVLARVIHFDGSLGTTAMDLCTSKAASRGLSVFIWSFVASGEIAPGTYPHRDDATGGQTAFWWKLDSSCQQLGDNALSTSGSVTLEAIDATHMAGTLDITFAGGDRVSGRFDAPVVAAHLNVCEMFGWSGGAPVTACPPLVCIP
jgi:hypothetical protein